MASLIFTEYRASTLGEVMPVLVHTGAAPRRVSRSGAGNKESPILDILETVHFWLKETCSPTFFEICYVGGIWTWMLQSKVCWSLLECLSCRLVFPKQHKDNILQCKSLKMTLLGHPELSGQNRTIRIRIMPGECCATCQNKTPLRERQGGWKTQGRGEETCHKTLPQRNSTYDTLFPPPVCPRPVIFLRGNGQRPDQSDILMPPKLLLEGALSFPHPQNRMICFALHSRKGKIA